MRADSNRDGVVDLLTLDDDTDETLWNTTRGAIFLANIDDDTSRCSTLTNQTDLVIWQCNDAQDEVVNGTNDLLDMAPLNILAWPNAPDGSTAGLTVTPAAGSSRVRFFYKNPSGEWVMFNHATQVFGATRLRAGVELRMEGKDIVRNSATWDGYVTVTLTVRTPNASGTFETPAPWDGGALYENLELNDEVRMRVSPVMTFSHMTPVVNSYATLVPGDPDSTDFRTDLQAALTHAGAGTLMSLSVPLDPPPNNYPDQWTQDFFETGYMNMPGPGGVPQNIRVSFRSANVYGSGNNPLRTAGKIVFTQFRGPDRAGVQQYDLNGSSPGGSTLNSFGNFETIPPYSHNGVDYPLGRVIRGNVPSYHPDSSFITMTESQKIQPPVYVDTSWLVVAHIDETVSFLPANTPRGWIMLVNDPTLARTMLEQQVAAGNGTTQMFQGLATYVWGTGWVSAQRRISAVLADSNVMNESAASAVEVEAQVAIIKAATGITDAEIVRIPYLHESIGGDSVAYQPGTVNGFLINGNTFAPPDPHGPVIGGVDIFKQQMQSALAPWGYTVMWTEDWYLYHINLGEVHCGSNATRVIPSTPWWETGR